MRFLTGIIADPINVVFLVAVGLTIVINILDLIRVVLKGSIDIRKIDKKKRASLAMLKMLYLPFRFFVIIATKLKISMSYINKLLTSIITILTFYISCRALYDFIYVMLNLIFGIPKHHLYAYISLSIILIAVSYFPDKSGLWMQHVWVKLFKLFRKKDLSKNYENSIEQSKKFIILLRPKLWVYFVSIIITIMSSIEKISGAILISDDMWIQIKPVIFESVLTLIVIDRFIKAFCAEYKIAREIKEVIMRN